MNLLCIRDLKTEFDKWEDALEEAEFWSHEYGIRTAITGGNKRFIVMGAQQAKSQGRLILEIIRPPGLKDRWFKTDASDYSPPPLYMLTQRANIKEAR